MNVTEYNQCVDLHADALYRFVLKNLRDADASRDVVQDTFEKMWRKVDEIDFLKSKSYLFTTGYHTMIDKIRKEQRSTQLEDYHDAPTESSVAIPDLKKVIDRALSTLSEIQRSVILLRDYEGYSYAEIGDITGLNESQVKVYIYRARIALKEYIGKIENVL